MKYKEFCEFMDKYVRHAGDWHNQNCSCVYDDHGVCECKLYENDGVIRQVFEEVLKNNK